MKKRTLPSKTDIPVTLNDRFSGGRNFGWKQPRGRSFIMHDFNIWIRIPKCHSGRMKSNGNHLPIFQTFIQGYIFLTNVIYLYPLLKWTAPTMKSWVIFWKMYFLWTVFLQSAPASWFTLLKYFIEKRIIHLISPHLCRKQLLLLYNARWPALKLNLEQTAS